MAKVQFTYRRLVTETIDWPDEEMSDFDYDTLMLNAGTGLEISDEPEEIMDVAVNGEVYEF